MKRFVMVLLISCGGKTAQTPAAQQPPPAATTPPDAAPVAEKPKTCDQDPEITKHARPAYECALAAMERGEYDIADALAESVMERFPYSKMSVLSELLRADVLFARTEWADAYAAYDRFVKFHPTHEQVETAKKKRDEAKAKSDRQ